MLEHTRRANTATDAAIAPRHHANPSPRDPSSRQSGERWNPHPNCQDKHQLKRDRRTLTLWALLGLTIAGLWGCATLPDAIPQVKAEARLWGDRSLDYLDRYDLEVREVAGMPFGGLSAIDYDRKAGRYLVLSDDRSQTGPARFYDLTIDLDREAGRIQDVSVGELHPLSAPDGQPYAEGMIDPEGLVITPDNTLLISSEGDATRGIAPFVAEFDRDGQHLRDLPLYDYFLPDTDTRTEPPEQTLGVQNNSGFESLTIAGRVSRSEPYRVFAATEAPLLQDLPDLDANPDGVAYSRLIHYSVINRDRTQIVAEHLYPLDRPPIGATIIGLTELQALRQSGHFLSLERAYGPGGLFAKIYEISLASATDIASLATLPSNLDGIAPVRKRLLFDFSTLEQPIDNLEGITFGPRLADGTQSLIIISDDNFREEQTTQIWLFSLSETTRSSTNR